MHERPSGAFRLPDQRFADEYSPSYAAPDPVSSGGGSHALDRDDPDGLRGSSIRGPEYPTIRPTGATSLADAPPPVRPTSSPPAVMSGPLGTAGPAAAAEPTSVVPPVADRARPAAEAVYHTRRPVSAILIAVVTVGLLIPALLLLVQVTFVDHPAVRGIVPAVLLSVGIPLAGGGLCALALGGPAGRDMWLRPPAIYLPVGLVLLFAAGMAVA